MSPTEALLLSERVQRFVESTIVAAKDGITVSEFARLFVEAIRLAVAAMDALPLPGEERKAAVMAFAGQVFDLLADKCVPAVAWPAWVLLKPAARSLAVSLSGGIIEAILPLIRGDH